MEIWPTIPVPPHSDRAAFLVFLDCRFPWPAVSSIFEVGEENVVSVLSPDAVECTSALICHGVLQSLSATMVLLDDVCLVDQICHLLDLLTFDISLTRNKTTWPRQSQCQLSGELPWSTTIEDLKKDEPLEKEWKAAEGKTKEAWSQADASIDTSLF